MTPREPRGAKPSRVADQPACRSADGESSAGSAAVDDDAVGDADDVRGGGESSAGSAAVDDDAAGDADDVRGGGDDCSGTSEGVAGADISDRAGSGITEEAIGISHSAGEATRSSADDGLVRVLAATDGGGEPADDGAGKLVGRHACAAAADRRSGSLRMLEGASAFGKRSATSSRACRIHLPRAAARSARWLLGDSTGLSTNATDSVSRPLASSANIAGYFLAIRATSMRRHASSSLMFKRATQ